MLWAAGCGHLDIVKYLVEACHCSPHWGQKGKRSFSGRTALHWSARNGHIDVVQYLVQKCHVNIDAATADGTMAFCWASWQGHLGVMKFLHESGADVRKSNSFGCNAVLWCSQGEGTVKIMQWLNSIGLDLTCTNSNGHGALHKAAQRKRRDICEWLCNSVYEDVGESGISINAFDNVGPDTEGCCPSDLAGMAGDNELALYISKQEVRLASQWIEALSTRADGNRPFEQPHDFLPKWLHQKDHPVTMSATQRELSVWEPWGGVRRIQSSLWKR